MKVLKLIHENDQRINDLEKEIKRLTQTNKDLMQLNRSKYYFIQTLSKINYYSKMINMKYIPRFEKETILEFVNFSKPDSLFISFNKFETSKDIIIQRLEQLKSIKVDFTQSIYQLYQQFFPTDECPDSLKLFHFNNEGSERLLLPKELIDGMYNGYGRVSPFEVIFDILDLKVIDNVKKFIGKDELDESIKFNFQTEEATVELH